jgi:hypothetical protein
MQQEVVLRKEASEEEPVPLLVGAFRHEEVTVTSELPPLGAKADSQCGTIGIEMLGPPVRKDAQSVECGP